MAYQSLLRLELLPKEEFTMLKALCTQYGLEGASSEVYSIMFGALIHLAMEVSTMRDAVVVDGEQYIAQVIEGYLTT